MDISLQNPRHCIIPNTQQPVRLLLSIAFASVKLEQIPVANQYKEVEPAKQGESRKCLWKEQEFEADLEEELFHFLKSLVLEVIQSMSFIPR